MDSEVSFNLAEKTTGKLPVNLIQPIGINHIYIERTKSPKKPKTIIDIKYVSNDRDS